MGPLPKRTKLCNVISCKRLRHCEQYNTSITSAVGLFTSTLMLLRASIFVAVALSFMLPIYNNADNVGISPVKSMCEQASRILLDVKGVAGINRALSYVQTQCFATGYLTELEIKQMAPFTRYIQDFAQDWHMAAANLAWLVLCIGIIVTSSDLLTYIYTLSMC